MSCLMEKLWKKNSLLKYFGLRKFLVQDRVQDRVKDTVQDS